MQIKSFWNPFSKINSGLNLEIYIDPSAWPAGSAVRIKENKPKGKIVFKKRGLTEKKKKTVQRNRKQRRRESNPVYLHVSATPWPLHHRWNTWFSADSRPMYLTIDQVSTDHRPSVDQLLTDLGQNVITFRTLLFIRSWQLCKPETTSRVCITVSNSPNPLVFISGYLNTGKKFSIA